jgi:hypothetical protein
MLTTMYGLMDSTFLPKFDTALPQKPSIVDGMRMIALKLEFGACRNQIFERHLSLSLLIFFYLLLNSYINLLNRNHPLHSHCSIRKAEIVQFRYPEKKCNAASIDAVAHYKLY